MKKMISFMLTLCLMFNSVSFGVLAVDIHSEEYIQAQALVANSQTEKITEKHIRQVADDLNKLKQTPFFTFKDFYITATTEADDILYGMTLADGTNAQFYLNDVSDAISITVKEGNLQNTLLFKENDIYLDGNKVEFSQTKISRDSTQTENKRTPRIATNVFTSYPVYGNASSYIYHTGQTVQNVVDFESDWINLTKTAVCWILAAALVSAGLAGALEFSDLFADVATWAIAQGAYIPNERAYMSFIYDTYVPATQPTSSLHWKLICVFFSAANCTGSRYNKTVYESYYY